MTDLQPCGEGSKALEILGDVAEEQTALRVAQTAKEHFGRVDVLVNNAGIAHISRAEDISAADFRRVQDVNLLGPFLMCREIGRLMLQQRSGSIVNVA